VPSDVYDHHLQSEAEPETRDLVLACVPGGCDLPLDAALAETARDHDPVEAVETVRLEHLRHILGLEEFHVDARPVMEACVTKRF
jgi:hypothetical protein